MRAADRVQAVVSFVAVALLGAVAAAVPTILAGCNAVFGIDPATLEATDSGSDEASTTDGGTGIDASADGAPAAADGGSDPLTCDNYCNVVAQNCQGDYAEYLTTADGGTVCPQVCATYLSALSSRYYPYPGPEPSEPAPSLLNSLGCRLWHAHAAADPANGGPTVHCRHAGPLGSTVCGGPIAAFCGLDYQYCTDNSSVGVYDGGISGCESTLGVVLAGDAGFYAQVDSGDLKDDSARDIESGNTLNCRLWHLEYAMSVGQPQTHCPHTGFPSVDTSGAPAPCQ